MTVISVEVFCQTRRELKPDPQIDAVHAIFFTLCHNVTTSDAHHQSGVFLFNGGNKNNAHATDCEQNQLFRKAGITVEHERSFSDESTMLTEFASFVQTLDPDILMGYEVQMLSWGYLIERSAVLNLNMCHLLSRILSKDTGPYKDSGGGGAGRNPDNQQDNWFGQLVNMTITGRIMLNVWRVMRSEVNSITYIF